MFLEPLTSNDIDYSELYRKLNISIIDNEYQHVTIESLEAFMARKKSHKLNTKLGKKALDDFMIQSDFYQSHCYSLGVLTFDNIYVIDGHIFFIGNAEILPIIDKYYVSINTTYAKDNVILPPELQENEILPFKTRLTLTFYSIGKIVQKIIFNNAELPIEELVKSSLIETKLYECIKRATKPNPNHRYLIYI